MNRGRAATGIAILVLLAVAVTVILLQGRESPRSQAAPTTASVTTTPEPPTTEAKPPKPQGENWLAIMRDILAYRHSLYANPRPHLLAQIYDKRCPCYALEQKTLADLQRRGQRYDDEGVEVLEAKLLGRARGRPSDVAVEVRLRRHPQVLLNRSGEVIERTPGSSAIHQGYELLRGPDGRWRVLFELPVASGRSRR